VPVVYRFGEFVRSGGSIASGPRVSDQARRAAADVDRILNGAKPADLPVEQPAAKALGLTIPPSLLQRGDEVIE
jgi:putative ABC transport system substrate-binding protein